eukprot:13448928-Alexandrium_andersonii.AAC.1
MELEELDSSSGAGFRPPCTAASLAAHSGALGDDAGAEDEEVRPDRVRCRRESGDECLAFLADRPRLSEPLRPLRR